MQGTAGSKFYPPISRALAAGRQAGGKVAVAFKAMHEDVDSFGGLPYHGGGDGRITTRGGGRDAERGLPVMMGCASAPWTGSLLLKQSAIECAGEQGFGLDMDAPPDVFACLGDGRERGLQSLADVLSGHKRVFVCGLALDFCVLDSCLNAVSMPTPPKAVHMVLDAARAAHIPGVGSYGSGFLSDPKDVLSKLGAAHVHLSSVESVTGAAPLGEYPLELGFPRSLGPLGLVAADSKVRITVSAAKQTYQVSEHARRVTRRRRAAKQRAQLPAQSSAACLCSPAAPPHTCCLTCPAAGPVFCCLPLLPPPPLRTPAASRAQLPAQSSAACLCSPRRPSPHLLPHRCLTAASPLPHRCLTAASPLPRHFLSPPFSIGHLSRRALYFADRLRSGRLPLHKPLLHLPLLAQGPHTRGVARRAPHRDLPLLGLSTCWHQRASRLVAVRLPLRHLLACAAGRGLRRLPPARPQGSGGQRAGNRAQ